MSLQRARRSVSTWCWCDALLKPATSTRVPAWAVRMHYGATMQQYTPASYPACTHIAHCVDWVEVHASESEPQCACTTARSVVCTALSSLLPLKQRIC